MSRFLTARNVAIVGVCGGVGLMLARRGNNITLTTPASQAIGDRWSSGGGTNVHTPAIATRRGTSEDIKETQLNPTGLKSQHFKDNVSSQKAEPGYAGKVMNASQYGAGNEKGK